MSERARRRDDRPHRREPVDAARGRIVPAAEAVPTASSVGGTGHVPIRVR